MNEKRFIVFLWAAKATLLAVIVYLVFEVATNRLHLGTVFDPGTASGQSQANETPAAWPETRCPSDYAEMVQRNLFKNAEHPTTAQAGAQHPPGAPGAAQELGLCLIGTLAGGAATSRAVIQDTQSNTTGSYRIGDTVGAATVEAIRRDMVVLQYQGRPVVLKQQSGKATGKAAGPGDKNDPGRGQPSGAKPTAGPHPQTGRRDQTGYMTDLFRQATLEPYVKNGQTQGLRLSGLENIPVAEMLGLQNGDIVQSVNGQQLTSKQKAFQVLMKARTQASINVQLLRDGQSKNLSFKL